MVLGRYEGYELGNENRLHFVRRRVSLAAPVDRTA
ncbi:hypothetical protein GGP42_001737 [Salinibacter ruber]|nr:hypothetical protein [Salinibacter ruber]